MAKTVSTLDALTAVLPLADGVYKGRFYADNKELPFAKLEVSNLGTKYFILYDPAVPDDNHTWNSKSEFYNATSQLISDGWAFEYEPVVTPAASTEGDKKKTTTSTTDMTSSSMSPVLLVGLAVLLLIILKKK